MSEAHKLLIGLSPRILRQVPAELGFRGKTLQYLEQSVAHWVMALGAMVVMVPTVERDSLIRPAIVDVPDFVAAMDGLILQGGADIDPRAYGEEPTHSRGILDPLRDRFELALLRAFVRAGKPVFGICRGLQLINVAFGGTLYQDLQADGATDAAHGSAEYYDQHEHTLRLGDDPLFARIYPGITSGRINSIHHQAVRTLGDGLRAAAWAEDGVIEAVVGEGPGFLVGVQWHPEFHDGRNPALLPADPLMHAFLDAARARRNAGDAMGMREAVQALHTAH